MKKPDASASSIAARVAALPSTPFAELKKLWAQLFDMPMPTHNRSYIERRIAYRMQELELAKAQPQLLASNRLRIACYLPFPAGLLVAKTANGMHEHAVHSLLSHQGGFSS